MIVIQYQHDIVEVPTVCKQLNYSVPLSRCIGAGKYLMAELLNDDVTDGVAMNPEAIHEGLVGITSRQVLQGDGQLQAYRQGSTVVGVLFFNLVPQSCDELVPFG